MIAGFVSFVAFETGREVAAKEEPASSLRGNANQRGPVSICNLPSCAIGVKHVFQIMNMDRPPLYRIYIFSHSPDGPLQ